MNKINLLQKFSLFSEHWTPKIIAELNDSHIKLARFKGDFVWHQHDVDELFLLVSGKLEIRFRDQTILMQEGEIVVVPKHVEHMPVADEEALVLLIEPKGTLNTGNVQDEKTVPQPEWI